MNKHWQYFKYVIRHKWYTLIECAKLGIFWRGIVHDLSKFSKAEWGPYVEWFYGERISVLNTEMSEPGPYKFGQIVKYNGWDCVVASKGDTSTGLLPLRYKQAFDMAWNNHQKRNKHHWQYWILTMDDEKDNKVLEMPEEYMLEMLADWNGAGKAITGKINTKAWYLKRRDRFKKVLHPNTRRSIEIYLGVPQE